jgi:hypothetical protein
MSTPTSNAVVVRAGEGAMARQRRLRRRGHDRADVRRANAHRPRGRLRPHAPERMRQLIDKYDMELLEPFGH